MGTPHFRSDKGQPHARYWTVERVIDAYQAWISTHQGTRPTSIDLYYDRSLPCYTTVYNLFGGIALVPQKA